MKNYAVCGIARGTMAYKTSEVVVGILGKEVSNSNIYIQ